MFLDGELIPADADDRRCPSVSPVREAAMRNKARWSDGATGRHEVRILGSPLDRRGSGPPSLRRDAGVHSAVRGSWLG
jgi:hypothetical protein